MQVLPLDGKKIISYLVKTFFMIALAMLMDGTGTAQEDNQSIQDRKATSGDLASSGNSVAIPVFGSKHRQNRNGWKDWYQSQRIYPGASLPSTIYPAAHLAAVAPESAYPVSWEGIGPNPIENITMVGSGDLTSSGRALCTAVHPNDPDTLLLGTAQGGIWRSTTGGRNFAAVSNNLPSSAVKVIRFAPSSPHIVYAGSGEPHSKTSIFGMGVFKSTDAGRTWNVLPAHGRGWDFRYVAVSGLQIDPHNPDILTVTTADVLPDRVNTFFPPPSVPRTGIFKSTDGGFTWTCKLLARDYRSVMYPEYDPYLVQGVGFTDLEMFQADPNVLFAAEFSGGIYRSVNGGETWKRITPVKNPGKIIGAGSDFPAPVPSFAYYGPNTFKFDRLAVIKRAVYIPEFSRIEIGLAQKGAQITTDFRTAILYAGVAAVLQLDANGNGVFDAGTDIEAPVALLFKSTDGGDTWEWLGDWLNGIPNYCDTITSTTTEGQPFMNGVYDNTVEVNPENADDIVVGGNANYSQYWPDPVENPTRMLAIPWRGMIYRSLDGGNSWTDTTPACAEYVYDADTNPINGLPVYKCISTPSDLVVHPDVHGATFDWANRRIYATTDGGLSRCTIGVQVGGEAEYSWESLNNNLATLQFFNFGSHPMMPDRIIGATQDNAIAFWNGTFWEAWDWSGGDGTVSVFDPVEPRYVYAGWQYALARNDHGGSNTANDWKTLFDSSIGNNDKLPFVTVFEIDRVRTNILYVGSKTGVYRSTDRGDHWQNRLNSEPTDGEVTCISVSPQDHSLVWAGTSTGHVYLFQISANGDCTAIDKTGANLPNRWITRIQASADDVYAATLTYSGYDANSTNIFNGGNGNAGRVFRTPNLGRNWINISGNLTRRNHLDTPVSALAVDPRNERRMWIGTDTGVLHTIDGGNSWAWFRGNMPTVAVMALEYNVNTGYLMAATFGRSIWRMFILP